MSIDSSVRPEKQTCVEAGSELKGTLTSECPVVVRGKLEGEIDAPALIVEESGSVSGKFRVKRLRSEGTLSGSVESDEVVLSGVVHSDTSIRAERLEVKLDDKPRSGQPGQQGRDPLPVSFGDCVLEVGEDPRAVREAQPAQTAALASESAEASDDAAQPPQRDRPAAKNGGGKKKKSKGGDEDEPSAPSPAAPR